VSTPADVITKEEKRSDLSNIQNYFSNKNVAILSALTGSFLFFVQHIQPVSGASLLNTMAQESADLQVN
jgi:hypothetical protein